MNVHDIHAKRDAELLAGLRETSSAIEPPPSLDPTAMAARAVRTVRRRRVTTAVTAGFAVLALTGAGIGVAVLPDRSQIFPGSDSSDRSDGSDSSADSTAARYPESGGGKLPVLDGVEHGVTESPGANPYILGGLWYEVPPGAWTAVGDVNAGGVAGFLEPDDPRASGSEGDPFSMSIDDLDATLELRNVTDAAEVARWTAPARDSGATTVPIEGADLVVVEQHEREGAVRPATITIRSGDEGWLIDTRFAADEQGETMLRNFVGNLWLKEAGEPDWFAPEFEHPRLEPTGAGAPDGWSTTTYDGLRFAVPEGWSSATPDGDPSAGVAWTGETVTHVIPGMDPDRLDELGVPPEHKKKMAQDVESFEQVSVEHGLPDDGDSGSSVILAPEWQMIDVPGADHAKAEVTLVNVDGTPDYYQVRIDLQQEGKGARLSVDVEFDGTEQGWADLNGFVGSLDLRG